MGASLAAAPLAGRVYAAQFAGVAVGADVDDGVKLLHDQPVEGGDEVQLGVGGQAEEGLLGAGEPHQQVGMATGPEDLFVGGQEQGGRSGVPWMATRSPG